VRYCCRCLGCYVCCPVLLFVFRLRLTLRCVCCLFTFPFVLRLLAFCVVLRYCSWRCLMLSFVRCGRCSLLLRCVCWNSSCLPVSFVDLLALLRLLRLRSILLLRCLRLFLVVLLFVAFICAFVVALRLFALFVVTLFVVGLLRVGLFCSCFVYFGAFCLFRTVAVVGCSGHRGLYVCVCLLPFPLLTVALFALVTVAFCCAFVVCSSRLLMFR